LQETLRLKSQQRHDQIKPVTPPSWQVAKATPPLDLGELRPLDL
jgi:hypothetical protein